MTRIDGTIIMGDTLRELRKYHGARVIKLERHKFSMKKGPDRFEFHGQEFDAVIENDQVMVTDKETGETIKRK